jgi:hypothetical protein
MLVYFSLVVVTEKSLYHKNNQRVEVKIAFCLQSLDWVAGWLCKLPQAVQALVK